MQKNPVESYYNKMLHNLWRLHPRLTKAFDADELKCRRASDSAELRWMGGLSPQMGDASISAHNTANYFYTSSFVSLCKQRLELKKRLEIPLLEGNQHWGGLRECFRATKLNDGGGGGRGRHNGSRTMRHSYVYFPAVPKQGRIFSTSDNEMLSALLSERRHVGHIYGGDAAASAAAALCFPFFPVVWTTARKRTTIRIQTIADKSDDPDCVGCSEVWTLGVEEEEHEGVGGIMKPKGVRAADRLTFLYTALATGNQGQL